MKPFFAILSLFTFTLAACNSGPSTSSFPKAQEDVRKESRGKVTGDDGLNLFGGGDEDKNGGNSPIGVNGFLWQATLDTLSFLPLTSADPFGGVVITDWYEDPKTPGERFKITALILDRSLRADGIKIALFKQAKGSASGEWKDTETNPSTARDLENTILTRARQLRVKQAAQ